MNKIACFTGVSALLCLFNLQAQFAPPPGGRTYIYTGDRADKPNPAGLTLDQTWSTANGSSDWDGLGRGLGVGEPGGVESVGGILTVEDAVNASPGFEPSNRHIYFTHDLLQESLANNNILDGGMTLAFRAKLTAASQELSPMPNGYGIFNGGKGNFGIRQRGTTGLDQAIISFSLVTQFEDLNPSTTMDFGSGGLTMNGLSGPLPTDTVDSASVSDGDAILNHLALDPTIFHDFWITIQPDLSGLGSHVVAVYLDGSITPTVFHVTAGTGNEGANFGNYLALGMNNTAATGAVDVDYFAYKEGTLVPVPEPSIFVLFGLGVGDGVDTAAA